MDLKNTDNLVLVLGSTGSGKSTFINTLLNQDGRMEVGNDLNSLTHKVDHAYLTGISSHLNDRIVLVDTPGFDDTWTGDYEILEIIAAWLHGAHEKGAKVRGVVYIYDISLERLTNTARRNLQLLQKLCGDQALKNVMFVTTKWDRMSGNAEYRLQQLKKGDWEPFVKSGSYFAQFDKTLDCQAAVELLKPLLSSPPVELGIQREMRTAPLWRTTVGIFTKKEIRKPAFGVQKKGWKIPLRLNCISL